MLKPLVGIFISAVVMGLYISITRATALEWSGTSHMIFIVVSAFIGALAVLNMIEPSIPLAVFTFLTSLPALFVFSFYYACGVHGQCL